MRFTVAGRVQPERANVFFTTFGVTLDNGGSALVSCDASQLNMLLELPGVEDWRIAHHWADTLAQGLVGSLGFARGIGWWAEIISVIDESGRATVIGVQPHGLEFDCVTSDDIYGRALSLSARDVNFRLALRDYLRAMSSVIDCSAYCYRTIEAIKNALAEDRDEKSAWNHMHDTLGTTRDEIESVVKKFADKVRHGGWREAPQSTDNDRFAMLKLTREVLYRYLRHVQPEHVALGGAAEKLD